MTRSMIAAVMILGAGSMLAGAQATVQVRPSHLNGPRELAEQTARAVVQDYVESWQTLRDALGQNRVEVLDRDFVGAVRDKIAETIQQQAKSGLRTSYQDRSHDIQIVFYSPEGLSIELTDEVQYDQQVFEHDKLLTTQHVTAHYIAVLTPSETRWRVRVLQAVTQ
ncbi:hypothetical protein DYQ86_12575 [Acidobacteria bacterium AB60]|nr:hypothetical protein DYQ86_12575 [Acidobacteria bacterium AB60]